MSDRAVVVVRYHEIALKGRNRPYFVRCLADHVRHVTEGLRRGPIRRASARLVLGLRDRGDWEEARTRLRRVFGVANVALANETPLDVLGDTPAAAIDVLADRLAERLRGVRVDSFRVLTKRSDKRFPIESPKVNEVLGARIKEAIGARVDLKRAELTVAVDLLPGCVHVSFERAEGPGGLPVGTSGRVLALLSGGIDSPVAAWRMMRRGCRVDFVHFHGAPFQDRTSQEKARALAELLLPWELEATLHVVPFGEIQRQIVANVARPLRVVLYRRMMLRIATALATRSGAQALVTGESLGQVASQTLTNLALIGEVTGLPVLRPLVGMDKQEIATAAMRLGTYETSVIPDQDCCQLFVPRSPATRARRPDVLAAEARLDVDALVAMAVAAVDEVVLRWPAARAS